MSLTLSYGMLLTGVVMLLSYGGATLTGVTTFVCTGDPAPPFHP
jgi:hypothetical protein